MARRTIHVVVACRGDEARDASRAIQQWIHTSDDRVLHGLVCRVETTADLRKAISSALARPSNTIAVAAGFREREVLRLLPRDLPAPAEIIVLTRPADGLPHKMPLATLLHHPKLVAWHDPIAAARKAILRLRTRCYSRIRTLTSDSDWRAYFSLRYQVWKQLRYIPRDKDCPESQWELDYTDRTAEPVGAFTTDGRLIGCARLVRGIGNEDPRRVSRIERLIAERRDPCLEGNFEYPRSLNHPYDILESFPKFREYYRELVTRGIRKAEVSRVIVHRNHQGSGLGEVLVDSLVALARARGIDVLFLACVRKHEHFYERSGFLAIEGLQCGRFVNVRVPAIAMERGWETV
jgi:GNAT superfamily N-acetyltransferase